MSDNSILFEHDYRGDRWRLEVVTHQGRRFANWRKWYYANGTWKPTREGCTFPLGDLWPLTGALMAYHGLPVPKGTESGS